MVAQGLAYLTPALTRVRTAFSPQTVAEVRLTRVLLYETNNNDEGLHESTESVTKTVLKWSKL